MSVGRRPLGKMEHNFPIVLPSQQRKKMNHRQMQSHGNWRALHALGYMRRNAFVHSGSAICKVSVPSCSIKVAGPCVMLHIHYFH